MDFLTEIMAWVSNFLAGLQFPYLLSDLRNLPSVSDDTDETFSPPQGIPVTLPSGTDNMERMCPIFSEVA